MCSGGLVTPKLRPRRPGGPGPQALAFRRNLAVEWGFLLKDWCTVHLGGEVCMQLSEAWLTWPPILLRCLKCTPPLPAELCP
jgi:hypothetical protein